MLAGLDIESSLKQLAERRTDIFGVEETAIGKKIGEEEIQKPEEKVEWKLVLVFLTGSFSSMNAQRDGSLLNSVLAVKLLSRFICGSHCSLDRLGLF